MPKRPQHPTHPHARHPQRHGAHAPARAAGIRRQPPGTVGAADPRRQRMPGDDPGTLTDEDYLSAGGPDAIDSATDE